MIRMIVQNVLPMFNGGFAINMNGFIGTLERIKSYMLLTIRNLITSFIKKSKKPKSMPEYPSIGFPPCEYCLTVECGLVDGNECDRFWDWWKAKSKAESTDEESEKRYGK